MCSCPFCKILINRLNPPIKDRVLYESKNFIVIPALGQFVEGYVLIVSKQHIPYMACLDNKQFKELIEIKTLLSKILGSIYESPIFFEHGSYSENMESGNSVHHAHIHVVGRNVSILNEVSGIINLEKESSIITLNKYLKNKESYIYYEETDGTIYSQKVDCSFPSQFMRQLLASKIGVKDMWDWKTYEFTENIESLVKKIQALIK